MSSCRAGIVMWLLLTGRAAVLGVCPFSPTCVGVLFLICIVHKTQPQKAGACQHADRLGLGCRQAGKQRRTTCRVETRRGCRGGDGLSRSVARVVWDGRTDGRTEGPAPRTGRRTDVDGGRRLLAPSWLCLGQRS
jgi:hypothetical protein